MADPINLASIYDSETPSSDEYLRRMRIQRDAILANCDWTHLTDAVVPDQAAWATYRQALRDAGFSDRDIWDIAATASFFNMSNRMAAATDMQPNDEYHAMAR